jgi:hypothetical protein
VRPPARLTGLSREAHQILGLGLIGDLVDHDEVPNVPEAGLTGAGLESAHLGCGAQHAPGDILDGQVMRIPQLAQAHAEFTLTNRRVGVARTRASSIRAPFDRGLPMTGAFGMCHGARCYTPMVLRRSMTRIFRASHLGIVPAARAGRSVHGRSPSLEAISLCQPTPEVARGPLPQLTRI